MPRYRSTTIKNSSLRPESEASTSENVRSKAGRVTRPVIKQISREKSVLDCVLLLFRPWIRGPASSKRRLSPPNSLLAGYQTRRRLNAPATHRRCDQKVFFWRKAVHSYHKPSIDLSRLVLSVDYNMARTLDAGVWLVVLVVGLVLALNVTARPTGLESRNPFPEDRVMKFKTHHELKAACSIPGVCSGPLKVYFASSDCSGSPMSYGCFSHPERCYPDVSPSSVGGSMVKCDSKQGLVQLHWSKDPTCSTAFDRSKSNPINTCISDGNWQSYYFVCDCDDIGDGSDTPPYFEACPAAAPYATDCPVFGPCPPTNFWMTSFNDSACTIPMYSYATVPSLPLNSCYSTKDVSTNKPSTNHITKCSSDGYIHDNYYLGSSSNPYLYETRITRNATCISYVWGYEAHYCKT
jgi:hypothetical protein